MIRIYHNPRCRKSREGLAVLEASGEAFEVIRYLEEPFTEETLKQLLTYLDIPPMALIRTQEALWKQEYKGRGLSDAQLLKLMLTYPQLIERPIVVKGRKAVVGRPSEKIRELLKA